MRDSKHTLINSFHHHIDNGGVTLEVYDSAPEEAHCTFDWMTLSESFYGYATGSLTIHNQGSEFLRKLGVALIESAGKLEAYDREKRDKFDRQKRMEDSLG